MAQTKRRRRSKHRGNAAGVVEARGRTSTGRGGSAPKTAAERRAHRLDQPPSWRSAANRAAVITLFAVALFVLVLKAPATQMLTIAVPMFLIYTTVNFYTDRFIYNRRQAKKTAGKG